MSKIEKFNEYWGGHSDDNSMQAALTRIGISNKDINDIYTYCNHLEQLLGSVKNKGGIKFNIFPLIEGFRKSQNEYADILNKIAALSDSDINMVKNAKYIPTNK